MILFGFFFKKRDVFERSLSDGARWAGLQCFKDNLLGSLEYKQDNISSEHQVSESALLELVARG